MHTTIKLNNPNEEFCLGIYLHKATSIIIEEDESETIQDEKLIRLVIGFLIFNIELIW